MSALLKVDIDARCFQGLLKGLIRRTFFGESKFNNEYLKANVMAKSSLSTEEIDRFFADCVGILQNGAYNDASGDEIRELFEGKFDCPDELCNIAKLYWASEKEKIHAKLCEEATWNNTMKGLSWRLDVTTARSSTSTEPEFREPVALVELNTGKNNNDAVGAIKFQMSKKDLNDLVLEVNKVQNVINDYLGTSVTDD